MGAEVQDLESNDDDMLDVLKYLVTLTAVHRLCHAPLLNPVLLIGTVAQNLFSARDAREAAPQPCFINHVRNTKV